MQLLAINYSTLNTNLQLAYNVVIHNKYVDNIYRIYFEDRNICYLSYSVKLK